jgi:hypothetical protein
MSAGLEPIVGFEEVQAVEPAIVDSIVKRHCGRMLNVGGKAEDISG